MFRTDLAVLLSVGSLLVFLAPCAPQTDRVLLPVTAPDAFSVNGEGKLPLRWWRVFRDEDLNLVVEKAIGGNFDLEVAWQRLREARPVAESASGPLYPDLEGTIQGREFHGDGDVGEGADLLLGLSSVYEIDLWGGIRSAAEAEQYRADAALADNQTAALTSSAEIVRAWPGRRSPQSTGPVGPTGHH